MATEQSPLRPGEYTVHDKPPELPNNRKMPPFSALLLLLGALALFIYPFVAIADLMSLAGRADGKETQQSLGVMHTLIYSTLAYPAVYVLCAILTFLAASRQHSAVSIVISAFPIIYVASVIKFFFWASSHMRH